MKNCKQRITANIPGMSNGGANPHMLGMGMAQNAGIALATRGNRIESALSDATSIRTPAISTPSGKGGMSARRDGATPPAHMLAAQRRGMKDGGMKRGNAAQLESGDGGEVRGPGGPTDDQVGPVAMANTEYLLPGDTVEAMGGPEVLDAIRAKTHTFVDEKNKPAIMQGMADGGQADKKKPWVSDFAKPAGTIPTMGQAVFGTNNTPSKPVGQSIGAGARVAADGVSNAGVAIGQAARNLDDTRKVALNIANNLPGAIAAPVANVADSVGADIRTGFTGQKYAGREFVGKPMFGGGEAQGTPVIANPAVQTDAVRARHNAIINGDSRGNIDPSKISAGDQAFMDNQKAAAGQPTVPSTPGMPTIGKINVSRQPNGVMSFSGKDQVDGYAGPAAGQLKGGGFSGAVSPADYQAAVARADADKASVVSLAASKAAQGDMDGAYRLAAGDPAATAAVEQALQQKALRQAVLSGNSGAASVLNNQGTNQTNLEAAKLKIAANLQPKPETAYDQERTRGAKMENDRSAIMDKLLGEFMGAKDDKARESALTKLNAINGKNGGDKYIMGEVEVGTDDLGKPIMRKTPFNTRTGQYVGMEGGGKAAPTSRAEYDTLAPGAVYTGPDGRQYTKGK
jgi:hypothetical protein